MSNKKEIDNRFLKFGTISFTATTRINDFIDYLEKGTVMGTRCKKCGQRYFPPRADCFNDLTSDMDWFEVKDSGKLLTFSTLKFAPAGFDKEIPYTIAVLDFGDYKVFGRVDNAIAEDKLSVGMPMKITVNKLPNEHINYLFTPA
jgi:hypothetical protein